jgi:Zn-dependent M16 (insulinase) family peptidase
MRLDHQHGDVGILEITGPEEPIVTDPNKQSKAALAYLCKPLGQLSEDVSEAEERFALSLTSSLLLNGPTAPMYKSLLADNRGSGYSPCTGYEGENLDGMFSVGLSDVAEKDAEWVVDTVEKTLQEVAENGFDQERIDAASHLVELSLREVKQHFGLGMIYNMVPLWVHGRDIFPNFHVSHLMGKVRAKLQEGPFLQNLIKHHFLENTHKVKVQMVADANYNADIGEQEQQKLKAKTQDLETADITELYQQGLALQAAQEEIVDPDVLPTLTVADIAPLGTYYDIEGATEQAQLKLSRQPSNGVAYFSGVVDTDSLALTPLQRSYLPLFADYVSMVGAGDLTYGELQQELELYSGGVGAGVGLTSSHSEIDTLGDTYLSFSVKALSKNVNRSFELLSSILTTPRFVDAQDRLKVLLGGTKSDLQDSGHVFAALHVKSFLTPQGYKRNELFGLPQVRLINTLKSEDPVEQDAIIEKLAHTLASISTVLAEQPSMFKKVLLTGDDDTLTVLQKNAENHWGLQGEVEPSGEHSLEGFQSYVNSSPKRAFFPLPIQVNHCALAVKTVAPAHPDSAVLMIAAEVLSWGYLHREIREKGGAYGGGCSSGSGVLAFRSYRDPNTLATIETFIKGGEWLADPDNFTDLNVSEAILSVFSGLDSPVGLSARGKGAFINGLTNAEKQEYRTRLLAVTKTDVLRVAEVYMNRAVMSNAPTCVIGAQETMPEKTLLAEQGWELCEL